MKFPSNVKRYRTFLQNRYEDNRKIISMDEVIAMAYRIVYETGMGIKTGQHRNTLRMWVMTGVVLLLFTAMTAAFWPEGREVLMEMLLPGDPEVTWNALETMATQLRSGEAIGDAVMGFCRDIVDGAKIPN